MIGDPGVWADACLVLRMIALDPVGLGVVLRAPCGPVRDNWLAQLRALLPPSVAIRRIPATISDDRLLGGLDLAATIAAGRPCIEQGVLATTDGGLALLAMAERVSPETAARICQAIDARGIAVERDGLALRHPARFGLIALDEGIAPDERPPAPLCERAAFWIDLTMVGSRDVTPLAAEDLDASRRMLPEIEIGHDILTALCEAGLALGIGSARAALFALRAARAHAALQGRRWVAADDAAIAGRLVLAPRATVLPPDAEPEPRPPQADADTSGRSQADDPPPTLTDRILAASQATLPRHLLASLEGGVMPRGAPAGKSGQTQRGTARGRPAGVRPGDPRRPGTRLHVVETLRAAAPWQMLRPHPPGRVAVRPPDFRIVRTRHHAPSTTIFLVDASGSTALHRLNEAKGAVELLLGECYVRRDRAALVAFRGAGAQVLLPPTPSLVRARRCLAALPGGGGTPLAAGLDVARTLAEAARRRGESPSVVLLTDGQANIARDGSPGRARAQADALAAARALRAAQFPALLIDAAPRSSAETRRLAAELGARWLALPHADAASVSQAARTMRAA